MSSTTNHAPGSGAVRVIALALAIILLPLLNSNKKKERGFLLVMHRKGWLWFPGGRIHDEKGDNIEKICSSLAKAIAFMMQLFVKFRPRESGRRAVMRETQEELVDELINPGVFDPKVKIQVEHMVRYLPTFAHKTVPGTPGYNHPISTISVVFPWLVRLPRRWKRNLLKAIEDGDMRVAIVSRREILAGVTDRGQPISPEIGIFLAEMGLMPHQAVGQEE